VSCVLTFWYVIVESYYIPNVVYIISYPSGKNQMASQCKTSKEHEPPYVDIFNCTVLNDEQKVTLLKSDLSDVHKYEYLNRG
jgi:hypothetical protein